MWVCQLMGLLALASFGYTLGQLEKGRNATALLVKPKLDPESITTLMMRHNAIQRTTWGSRSKLKGIVTVPVHNFILPEPSSVKSDICTIGTDSSVGYRSMCWFWYARAWKILADMGYHFVLRIDDDVMLKKAEPWPSHPAVIAAPTWTNKEVAWVMNGMDKWFSRRFELPPQPWPGPPVQKRNWLLPPSPMTQLMMVDVQAVVSDSRVSKLWQDVYDTNCIYINRWGDLPLWGYTVAALQLPTFNITGWEYFHGSHHRMVRSGWYTF